MGGRRAEGNPKNQNIVLSHSTYWLFLPNPRKKLKIAIRRRQLRRRTDTEAACCIYSIVILRRLCLTTLRSVSCELAASGVIKRSGAVLPNNASHRWLRRWMRSR